MRLLSTGSLSALAIALSVSIGMPAHAQTREQAKSLRQTLDVNKLDALAEQLRLKNEANEAAVQRYLAAHPGVQRTEDRNGKTYRIIRIGSDGNPVYQVTKGGSVQPKSNVESAQLIKADKLYTGDFGANTGTNMTAGIWEPGLPRVTHELLAGKVTIQAGQGDFAVGSSADHASHVSGTIVGKDGLSGNGASARGVAYSAVAKNWSSDGDDQEATAAAGTGLLVSNHSYGLANDNTTPVWQFGAYDDEAKTWDVITKTAPTYLPFFAGGNEQQSNGNSSKNGYDLITGATAAKNVVTVGALDANKDMSEYSNWGPTDDGRVKPEIVARGTGINSAQSANDTAYSGSGANSSGTSYATPAATAAALLLQQYYGSVNAGAFMKASTLKTLLMGTTEDLGTSGPDYKFGYGLLNAEAAAFAIKKNSAVTGTGTTRSVSQADSRGSLVFEWPENPAADSTTEATLTVVAKGGVPLVVNLGWTDDEFATAQVAGDGPDVTTDRMVYDFDVAVRDAGNTLTRAWVVPGMANRTNAATVATDWFQANGGPMRQVILSTPTANATYTIVVRKKTGSPAAARMMSMVVTGLAENAPGTTYAITTAVNPANSGTVTCTPNPVSSGQNATCTQTPNNGFTFANWSGDCTGAGACTLTNVTTAKTVTANYTASAAVQGTCGTANNSPTATAPAANLCASGTASAVAGAGNDKWNWSCAGSNGGITSSCSASYASQTLTISANPTSIAIGASSTVTINNTAGRPATPSTTSGSCTLGTPSGAAAIVTVSATGAGTAGTCTVKGNVAGTGDVGTSRYVAATEVSTNITVTPIAPAAPTALSAAPGNASAIISFTQGSNGGAAITNYEYSINQAAFVALAPAIAASPVTINGLTNGTTYSIRLRALNSVGAGGISDPVSVTPSATAQPTAPAAAPTGVTATAGDRRVTLTFQLPANIGTVTNLEYSTNGGTSFQAFSPAVTSSPVTITGLNNGTLYSIVLRAVNAVGTGPSSSAVSAMPLADNDTDGVSSANEDAVPSANGAGAGDGNGDGIADSTQISVSSFPASNGSYTTLVSASGKSLSNVASAVQPSDFPTNVGSVFSGTSFSVSGLTNGATEQFQLFVTSSQGIITGLRKKNLRTGTWDAIPSTITTVGVKTRIVYSLTDGGDYDTDRLANGVISDPVFVVGTPPSTPVASSGGGGGSFGWLTLIPLAGAALRRRKRH